MNWRAAVVALVVAGLLYPEANATASLYPDDRAIKSSTTRHFARAGCADYWITYRANVPVGTNWHGTIKAAKGVIYVDGVGPATRHARLHTCATKPGWYAGYGAITAITADGQQRFWSGRTGWLLTLVKR